MRCFICDAVLSEPKFNSEHDDYEPCHECSDVVADTLAGYLDRPSAEEDELGGPDPLLERLASYAFRSRSFDTGQRSSGRSSGHSHPYEPGYNPFDETGGF